MKKIALHYFIVSVVATAILGIVFLNLSITPSKAFGKTQYKLVDTGTMPMNDLGNLGGNEGVMNHYASDGWELVQACLKPSGSFVFIFKK